jgi:hypothetical protein
MPSGLTRLVERTERLQPGRQAGRQTDRGSRLRLFLSTNRSAMVRLYVCVLRTTAQPPKQMPAITVLSIQMNSS